MGATAEQVDRILNSIGAVHWEMLCSPSKSIPALRVLEFLLDDSLRELRDNPNLLDIPSLLVEYGVLTAMPTTYSAWSSEDTAALFLHDYIRETGLAGELLLRSRTDATVAAIAGKLSDLIDIGVRAEAI